jgi:hypothetical protein
VATKTKRSPEPKRNPEPDAERPSFAEVQRELTKALGAPKKSRGILRYPAPESATQVAELVARVRAAGGSASLAEAYPARQLCVVDGPPSMLMDLVTWVSWQSKSARKALDMLHADADLTISNIDYTDFLVTLARVPKDPAAHAKRLAKIVMQGDAAKIEAALNKRRWRT